MYPADSSKRRSARTGTCALLVLLFLLSFTSTLAAQEITVSGFLAPPDSPSSKAKPSIETQVAQGLAPLSRVYDYIELDASKTRRLPALNQSEIPSSSGQTKRLQIGVSRTFMQDVASSSSFYEAMDGQVGVMGIISEGALRTRVHFANTALPEGAKIFVYSMKNPDEFYGPFEGSGPLGNGTFWTPPVEGDGIVVEYFIPDSVRGTQSENYFLVSEVSHEYKDAATCAQTTDGGENIEGPCHNDITAEWTTVAKSVGRLSFIDDDRPGTFGCTGTLLNTTNNSQTPYLLTANHCFNSQTEAQSLRVYWNYNSAGSLPGPPNRTDGANLLATGTQTDFTFVLLTGAVPGGLYYTGWTSTQFTGNAPITGIHHPDGSYKRISFGTVQQTNSCGFPGLQCVRTNWTSGVTEPGSSGSGIWTGSASDPKFIGTLTGGDSACGANEDEPDFYGRFDLTFNSISSYLIGNNATPTPTPTPNPNSTPTPTPTPNLGNCTVTPINFGQTVNGALATSDCRSPFEIAGNQFYADLYSFSGAKGQQVSIQLTAGFDTYLTLAGPSGSVVAEDDDGGGGSNSRIPAGNGFFPLPDDGTYFIEVSSFDPNITGSYQLTLSGTTSLQLSALNYSVNENAVFATVTVTRTGSNASAATVNYKTSDTAGLNNCNPTQSGQTGKASERCDYGTSIGTLRWAAGEGGSKTFSVPVVDDKHVEGAETLTITLSGATGVALGVPSSATLTINDNDSTPSSQNPIDDIPFFVNEQYIDMLGRLPDQTGFNNWVATLQNCPGGIYGNAPNSNCDRVHVAKSTYQSVEFQTRGYWAYRFYEVAFGRRPNYAEFIPDMAQVGGPKSPAEEALSKDQYIAEFAQRSEFTTKYNSVINNPTAYVELLLQTAGLPNHPNKNAFIASMSTKTPAQVLRDIVESQPVEDRFYVRGFVSMMYYGFLRRDPDQTGFDNYVLKLNTTGDARAMTFDFIYSPEYLSRFGQP
jgi:hypothetical protein